VFDTFDTDGGGTIDVSPASPLAYDLSVALQGFWRTLSQVWRFMVAWCTGRPTSFVRQ
jgi:hypothetical protein